MLLYITRTENLTSPYIKYCSTPLERRNNKRNGKFSENKYLKFWFVVFGQDEKKCDVVS